MKKTRYFILFLFTFLLISPKVYAACTETELKQFKEIENKFTVTYTYNANDQNVIKLYNPDPENYEYRVIAEENKNPNITFNRINDNTYEATGNIDVEYKVIVVNKKASCDDMLKTFTISPPPENGYSDDPLCEGIEEFILCQEGYNKPVTREDFESRVEAYKESIQKDNDINTSGNNDSSSNDENSNNNKTDSESIINKITSYIKENLVQVIIIIIFIILLIVTAIISIKSAIKSRRLEW